MWGYLSDKLNIPVSDLTRTNAIAALQNEGIEEEQINSLSKILDACEFARFAPSSSGLRLLRFMKVHHNLLSQSKT